MIDCAKCKRYIWFWQDRASFTLHRHCYEETILGGVAAIIKILEKLKEDSHGKT